MGKEEKKRQDEERRKELAEAALATPFQPSAAAMLDPKAYFAQWQQHQKTCQSTAEKYSRPGAGAKGQGRGQGGGGPGMGAVQKPVSAGPSGGGRGNSAWNANFAAVA